MRDRPPGWSQALRTLAADPDDGLSELGAVRAARLLRTIADPTRVGIVAVLAEHGPMTRNTLVAALTSGVGSIVAHLQELIDAGVIDKSTTGDPADPPAATYGLSVDGRRTLAVIALVFGSLP